MNISLLGCGRWGSFIGWYLDKIGHNVNIWGLSDAPQFIELRDTRKNNMLTFRDSINITDDLQYAVTSADILIISISAQALRSFVPRLNEFDISSKKIVLCMKGIEEGRQKPVSLLWSVSGSRCRPDRRKASGRDGRGSAWRERVRHNASI